MDRPMHIWYQIRVQGHLDASWSAWFDGLTITHDADDATTLYGPVVDQVALYRLIGRARDVGLTLLAVNRVMVAGLGDPVWCDIQFMRQIDIKARESLLPRSGYL